MGFDHLHHSKRKNAGENVIRQQAAVSASFNGGNNNQSAPVLLSAAISSSGTAISGTLAGSPGGVRIELFSNQSPDPSGFGEGQTFLGFTTTDAQGNFTANLPAALQPGTFLAATATDAAGDTSEFSADITAKVRPSGTVAPDNLTYGTALAGSQLGGSLGGVAGSFAFTGPDNGTVLQVSGSPYTEAFLFTPTDTADYTTAAGTVAVTINKANQTITWGNPPDITYGTALGAAQLNAAVAGVAGGSATGDVTYTPLAGTVLGAGSHQDLHVDVAATNNYNAASADVFINVKSVSTSTTVSSSADPSPAGQSVTFTAVVSNASGTAAMPTGTVQFVIDGTTAATVPLSGGMASYSTSNLAVGSHSVLAVYSSDTANFTGSSSGVLSQAVGTFSSIASNFNGTAVAAGSYLWFSNVLSVSGLSTTSPTTIWFVNQTISAGSYFNLQVPNARITYHPGTGTSTTAFVGGAWHTDVYLGSGLSGNQFLSGMAYLVPTNLPGGLNPVSWSGLFFADASGVSIQWKWAAAVYTALPYTSQGPAFADYAAMDVKPVDDTRSSSYQNSDHAGTPEGTLSSGASIKSKVIGGARGGGGSNYTGGYSGTGTSVPLTVLDQFFSQLGSGF
jgi:hypothetical protein